LILRSFAAVHSRFQVERLMQSNRTPRALSVEEEVTSEDLADSKWGQNMDAFIFCPHLLSAFLVGSYLGDGGTEKGKGPSSQPFLHTGRCSGFSRSTPRSRPSI